MDIQNNSYAVLFGGKDQEDNFDPAQQPTCKILKDKDVKGQKFLAFALFHTVALGHSKLPEIIQFVVNTEGKETAQRMPGEIAEICLRLLSRWQNMAKILERSLGIFVHLASGGP